MRRDVLRKLSFAVLLTACDGSQDNKRLFAGGHGVRQGLVRRLVRQIILTGEEPHEGPTLLRDVVADRAAKHWIPGFQSIQHGTLSYRAVDLDLNFAVDVSEGSKMGRKNDSDHGALVAFSYSRAEFLLMSPISIRTIR